jgi:2-hydroxychromene-2-carboxylate isomerase
MKLVASGVSNMAAHLEFFFDYGSPFSYLADTQLPDICARTGAQVIYRPFLLGGVFKATGNSSPINVAPKLRYMMDDLQRWAKHYGIAKPQNPHFPINTIALMRGAVAARRLEVFPAYHRAIYDAFWLEGLNLGDVAVVREALNRAGLDANRLLAACEDAAVKDELRAGTEEAVARGAFGAPTFFVGNEMFWGNDRLMFVEEILRALA